MKRFAPAVLLLALPLAGCQGWQSALDAQGPAARTLAQMFWIFTGALSVVWLLTMCALLLALRKRRAAGADPLATNPTTEPRMSILVSIAIGLTMAIVRTLTALRYGRKIGLYTRRGDTLTRLVTGWQWW